MTEWEDEDVLLKKGVSKDVIKHMPKIQKKQMSGRSIKKKRIETEIENISIFVNPKAFQIILQCRDIETYKKVQAESFAIKRKYGDEK